MESAQERLKFRIDRVLHRLDQTLIKIDNYKPLLDHHCSCAEFEIRANFDSLIDALNHRQHTLLKQLSDVYKEKVLLIESHKQKLDALRTNLKGCLSAICMSDPRIHDLLSRAESDLDNYVSDPFISFRNEHSTLPQTIASYGRVVSRYGGHFAIPGQHSSSLPLEMEEEDDEPDVTRDHSTVCSRVSTACTCVKPDLQQWLLSKSHDCCHKHKHPGSASKAMNCLFSIPVSCQMNNECVLSRAWPDVQLPRIPTDCSRSTLCSRKQSTTQSSGHSDCPSAAVAESFSVLSDSATAPSDSLRDWLFCTPQVHLRDIPGLSTSLHVSSIQSHPTASHVGSSGNWSDWLAPSTLDSTNSITSFTSSTCRANVDFGNVARAPLLPVHLTQEGPVDMTKWLLKDPSTASLQSGETVMNHSHTELTSEAMTTESVSEDPSAPDCCIYTQCRGGPGGPTCCGARMQCANVDARPTDAHTDTAAARASTVESLPAPVTSSSVTSQLNQVVAKPLSHWLVKSSLDCAQNVCGANTKSSHSACDERWLHPSAVVSMLDKSDISAVCDSTDVFTMPPKRPNVDVSAEAPKMSASSAGSDFSNPHFVRGNADAYERWLTNKLSNLSTSAGGEEPNLAAGETR